MEHDAQHAIVPAATFVWVWLCLLALTGALVAVNSMHLGNAAIAATLLITPIKASLVFYYFMHLKYEGVLLKLMVFVTLATLVIFLGLLMVDYSYR